MNKKNIKVLFAAAECAPFAKVGGLADVVGSLPPALIKLGIDARVIMPFYGSIEARKFKLKKIYSDLEVPSGYLMIKVNIWEGFLPAGRVKIYFIEAPEYFKYNEVYIRGNNSERFLFFSSALLYALPLVNFIPEIIHCHDSHVGLIPDILQASNLQYLRGIKTLFTIHNLNYQGIADAGVLSTGNLHSDSTESLSRDARDGDVNFMVQGILSADLVNTVSKAYAKEISTSSYGANLEKIIRSRKSDLSGILNGLDTGQFNPQTDKLIKYNYTVDNLDKKNKNKLDLQKQLNLQADKNRPMFGLVSRLSWQKGLDIITPDFHKLDCQFVFLGSGQEKYEKQLLALAKKFPKQISANITFSEELAHKIYAASDMFLMPSRYEPCGLGQMIAMRYGTIPVVRATGGLEDTVNLNTGFKFREFSSSALYEILAKAIKIYQYNPKRWRKMQIKAMEKDFSWDKSAKEYIKLYKKLIK